MPTWGEAAQIVTALSALTAVFMSWRNGRKIEVVRHATNSMKDALVLATGDAAHAAGLAEGVAAGEVKAANLVTSNLSKKI